EDLVDSAQLEECALAVAGLCESSGQLSAEPCGVGEHRDCLERRAGITDETDRAGRVAADPHGECAAAVGPGESDAVSEALSVGADALLDLKCAIHVPQVTVCLREDRKQPMHCPECVSRSIGD